MKAKFSTFFLFLLISAFTQTSLANPDAKSLARNAISEDSAKAEKAIAELRAMGPAGLDILFKTYASEIKEQVANPLQPATPEWQRLSAALDAVSQQKNSYLSGLYWYTDFDQAKAAARAEGKPILELRLLGKLSEEYSCANSRFFRTILYANADVSKLLRERFILHWQSERPAPRVTIDFGDGRKLERTLTGNSIHYVLDFNGRVIDALPGLYGPAAFLRSLNQAQTADNSSPAPGIYSAAPVAYPRARLDALNVSWYADIKKTGGRIPQGLTIVANPPRIFSAVVAAPAAVTKMVTEIDIVRPIIGATTALGSVTDQDTWNKIAQLHLADAQLDSHSLGLIRRQTQDVLSGGATKNSTFQALVNRLEQNIALDTVRNEYLMHTKLYSWLMTDKERDVNKLNKRVYSELFLTPASDPWLGLYTADVYTALDGGGLSRK